MSATPGAFARVALIALVAVILQLSGFGPDRLFGGQPDLVPLAVAAVAVYAGSVAGAATGFGTGVLLDLAVGGTMGASSLVLSAVGYGVGRYREVRDPAHGLMPIPVGALATLGWVTAFAAVSFMLDVGASVSPLVFRDMLLTIALNAVIALPVFALCRRVLRPALLVDPLDLRRRRQPPREAGPLGLRGLEI
ncbi:MAG: rod shape-determining protein MreD [Thermoleophilaceae bacterium]|nr:rod shape-determining protein MreD [Thermoleophilaceae bacterium]